jgi:type I restriction enzyme S subunit
MKNWRIVRRKVFCNYVVCRKSASNAHAPLYFTACRQGASGCIFAKAKISAGKYAPLTRETSCVARLTETIIDNIRITDIQDNTVDWERVPFTNLTEGEAQKYFLERDDILFARTGGTVGKSFIVPEIQCESVFASYLIRVKTILVLATYLKLFFECPLYWEQVTNNINGTAQPNVNGNKLSLLYLPLPPLAEQKRIVEKVSELQPFITKYDAAEQRLTALNAAFPATLKKSILQAAVQGKLVEQDPADEPASVLLERIRIEKAALVKASKAKKDKHESIIYRRDNSHYEKLDGIERCIDDEIPFEVPDSWAWVRLGTLCNFGDCENTESTAIAPDAWLLDLEDIEKDTGRLVQRKRKHDVKSLSTKHGFTTGQVLYSKLRPYLNKVIIADEDGFCSSEILPLDFDAIVYNRYAQAYLMSPYFVSYATQCSYGVKMPRLGTQDGKNALVALPPLAEQRRIVERIDAVTPLFVNF